MCCDTRTCTGIYAVFACFQNAVMIFFVALNQSGYQSKYLYYVELVYLTITLIMHFILFVATVTLNKKLMGIFITYLKICVIILVFFLIFDVSWYMNRRNATKGEKRMAGMTDNEYPLLKHFQDGYLQKIVSTLNEEHFVPGFKVRRRHRRTHEEDRRHNADISVFKSEFTFGNHVISFVLNVYWIWSLNKYYDTMEEKK
ncbi:uncharacterized protein LOC135399001 [Ornithodoros turicata]|uniref:uncharacterized protein LOC135399001 n=1 Tax=Ornithodoros turicata TaxID=34597 RepID=UPI00313A3E41